MRDISAFNPVQVIAHKRDGQALEEHEIAEFIRRYVTGDIPEHQMAALAMAILLRGMSADETLALTGEMLRSGETLSGGDRALRVDKHSTGGIGDKSSFIITPLLACCGLQVPMISGRGLGATGGTLDKLESIPGVRTDLSSAEVQSILDSVGCVITGATANLVPADRKLYALRDVTATVPSRPLMTASIMSKKLAENISALVLDVKVGSGAFMKSLDEARALAESMVRVGAQMNVQTTALLTSMDQPNGRLVGNSVEIDEVLETLAGRGPADLKLLVCELAGEILLTKHLAASPAEAHAMLDEHLGSGRALARFVAMIEAQGGRLDKRRPRGPSWTLTAPRAGFVHEIDAENLGLAIVEMGGGRKQLGDAIDHGVGLEMLVRLGERVERGQDIMNIFAPTAARSRALRLIEHSIHFADEAPPPIPLVIERIRAASAPELTVRFDEGHVHGADRDEINVSPQQRRQLVDAALTARQTAYAPYSGFKVGAAVLAESGKTYVGANVENASFGLTICAERVAMAAAVAAGERRFKLLAVASPGGSAPCGACRQFAAELASELPILLVDSEQPGEPRAANLRELLPQQFQLRGDFEPQGERSNQNAGDAGRHEASQHAAKHRP